MELTLVPFGYLTAESKLVDVHQVPSGKRCGCLCPSCRAPLVARKGKKKIWHFAHDSKSEVTTKLERCSYSFYVSARMMALQLIEERLSIKLPKYVLELSEQLPFSDRYIQVSETVTESSWVVICDISINEEISGSKVDLLGHVDGYPLAIIFSHPGRKNHWHVESISNQKAGVVEISLDALKDRFRTMDSRTKTYSDVLENYITSDLPSKKWIYHPRLLHCETVAKSKLIEEIARASKQSALRSNSSGNRAVVEDNLFKGLKNIQVPRTKNTRFMFTCRLCNSNWVGTGEDKANCQKCGTALLVSRSEIPDDEA